MSIPQLSIIVPVYNESGQLPAFFDTLSVQQGVEFELIICDGESSDATLEESNRLAAGYGFPARIIETSRGRSRQLNAGAAVARFDTLLFLHIDSRFTDPEALRKGWNRLKLARQQKGAAVAGHFSLAFGDGSPSHAPLYYHMESKARLDRPECTHGDQGFMLAKSLFEEFGPFDELYPLAEDTRFADKLRTHGHWILFPEIIETSARRFEVEGVVERQTLNSILMNFVSIGFDDFFTQAADIYATQDRAGRLQLYPYYRLIRRLIDSMPFVERLRFWYATGSYVRANAWQIPFYFDTRYQCRFGLKVGEGEHRRLAFHDAWIEPLLDHPPGRALAGFLTWAWFQVVRRRKPNPAQ